MKRFFAVLAVVVFLGFLEWFMGAPEIYGAEIELQTAGSPYADPQPFYKGS